MSKQQFNNFRLLKGLLKELCGFGLNPHDWKIARLSAETLDRHRGAFKISHRLDHEFQMIGQWTLRPRGLLSVRGLSVLSL